ncbi:amidase [Marinimicrobium sp. ABcell2]|uniref:amidase n=1 Tax=Marinimicrobium sp. ABcell2 TaxID=3069751 RepID=UPI0027B8281F|nr:amidase [Marinimicrobium sp. ABcell2]MDQ2075628.1 amidase [Marinimicrobium sp. ABcell2]
MKQDVLRMTATNLREQYNSRGLSPVEVATAMLAQISRVDKVTNGFSLVDEETTLALARQSEQRYQEGRPVGLLDGVPVALTDVFLTPMWPTVRGSRTVDPASTLDKSSPATAALARHGYVPMGKTTTSELAWKAVTDNPVDGITNNPWDPDKTSGGSSGGSAVAVALGMAPLALGTDAGGSIRIPASFCGVVGFKPSFGEVPYWPQSPFGTLSHAGPLSWTVADCALMMNVLTEADHRDTYAIPRRGIDYTANLEDGVKGLRIAYSPNLGYVDVDSDVEKAVAQAADVFAELGAHVVRADPGFSDPLPAFGHLFYGGAANALRELGPKKRSLMDPELVKVAEKAGRLSMLDYLGALNEARMLRERMANFFNKYDLLLTPTLPLTAFKTGREVPPDWPSTRWPTWTPFTYPFNMTGQPALSVPCAFDSGAMPIGLQLVGRNYNDALVLQAGHAYQQAAPLTDKRPSLFDTV